MELANGGIAEHGTVIITGYQTQGKGQQGNHWHSVAENNLLFSVILDTSQQEIASQFLLNAAFCSGVAHLLMNEFELPNTCIKWPNDIYVGKKKIAGTLIENVIRGQQWQYAIVGIGININQHIFPQVNNATSIRNITNKETNLIQLRKSVFKYLNEAFGNFILRPNAIIDEYNSLLYGIGEKITYIKQTKTIQGQLHGASTNGFLKIGEEQFRHGEIKLVL